MDAGLSLDPDLVAAFNGPDPDASYAIDSQTAAQGAAALTLGYRGDSSFLMRSVIETASISQ